MQQKMKEMVKKGSLEEKIKLLAHEIKQTAEFQNYWTFRKLIQKKPGIWGLIQRFEVQKKKLNAPMVHPMDVQKLRVLAQEITKSQEAINYYQSLKELSGVFRMIHLFLSEKIGFRFGTRVS